MFCETLKMNNNVIDNFETKILQEIQKLVDKHIQKKCKPSSLKNDDKAEIKEKIKKVWNKTELIILNLLKTSLFSLDALSIVEKHNIIYFTKSLFYNLNYLYVLSASKMNHYFEFWTSQDLNWTVQQLAVVNHLKVQLYSQST